MKDCISMSRTMSLYYHHLHNIAKGIAFEGDHEMMLEFYEAMDDAYDSLIERHIGMGGSMDKSDFLKIVSDSHGVLMEIPGGTDFVEQLHHAQVLEADFRRLLEEATPGASIGTQNLYSQLADDSEVRSYKIGQRLK